MGPTLKEATGGMDRRPLPSDPKKMGLRGVYTSEMTAVTFSATSGRMSAAWASPA